MIATYVPDDKTHPDCLWEVPSIAKCNGRLGSCVVRKTDMLVRKAGEEGAVPGVLCATFALFVPKDVDYLGPKRLDSPHAKFFCSQKAH